MSPLARKDQPAQQQKRVDRWNAEHPVGTEVEVTKDLGEVLRTRTRSRAELLSGHTAVIWLEGVRGCYLLERVRAVEPLDARPA